MAQSTSFNDLSQASAVGINSSAASLRKGKAFPQVRRQSRVSKVRHHHAPLEKHLDVHRFFT
jgi:hypothetical protein